MSRFEGFKNALIIYINHFSVYDYAAYAWLILLFFVTILLSVFIAKKSPPISIFIFIISLVLLFGGPFIIKKYLDEYLRPTQSKIVSIKKLIFSDALIVIGEIKNISKKDYSTCNIQLNVHKIDSSYFKNLINKLKPLRKKTISLHETLEVNTTKELRVVFDNYTYADDVNASIDSTCY